MVGETFDSGQVFTEAVDDFTALFYSDRVFIGAREYPIGQCVVDILNLEESELFRIDQILMEFFHTVQEVWEQDTEKSVLRAQKKLQDVWNLVSVLPVYRDLNIDWLHPVAQNAPLLEKLWSRIRYLTVEGRAGVDENLRKLMGVNELLRTFQKQISLMLDGYFESLERRNSESYAVGVFQFYSDIMTAELLERGTCELDHSFPIKVQFVPMLSPVGEDKVILAERTRFSALLDFLEVEFFRGLSVGNVPRRCHNCGKYFLLTAGYIPTMTNNSIRWNLRCSCGSFWRPCRRTARWKACPLWKTTARNTVGLSQRMGRPTGIFGKQSNIVSVLDARPALLNIRGTCTAMTCGDNKWLKKTVRWVR